MKQLDHEEIMEFFNDRVTLVPVPRSSPLQENALWPSFEIAKALQSHGFGNNIKKYVSRNSAVKKSSMQPGAEERPSVNDHYKSLVIVKDMETPSAITLVDDVLSLGRTLFACALRLWEVYPNAEIRCFTMLRTRSFVADLDKFVDPSFDWISFNESSGKTTRHPV